MGEIVSRHCVATPIRCRGSICGPKTLPGGEKQKVQGGETELGRFAEGGLKKSIAVATQKDVGELEGN